MVEVRLEENEPIENALKRFKKVVQNSGLISEMKKREFYEKPSERRKRDKALAPEERSVRRRDLPGGMVKLEIVLAPDEADLVLGHRRIEAVF